MKKIYSMLILFALVCFGTLTAQADDLTLGPLYSGTNSSGKYIPLDGGNADYYQHVQVIYPKADLEALAGNTITKMTFYLYSKASAAWNAPIQISLAEVDDAKFSSSSYISAELTQVYSGTELSGTGTEMVVTFQTPFAYSGEKNLLFDLQITAKSGTYKSAQFRAKEGDGYDYNSLYANSSSAMPTTGSRSYARPQTLFTYEEPAAVGGCNKPKKLTLSTELPDGATFTWEQNVDETTYQWACVTSGSTVEAWNTLEANVRTKTVEGLTAGTAYDFYVRSYCGDGENEQSDAVKKTFTPTCPAPTFGSDPVSDKTYNSATVTWNAADGISKYQFVCVLKDVTPDWTDVEAQSVTSVELTSLTELTNYDFYVRSWYSATSISDAVKTSFKTAADCSAKTIDAEHPWTENFNSTDANSLPACWSAAGNTSAVYVASSGYVSFSSKGLYFTGSGGTQAIAILPEFETDLNTLQIAFKHVEENTTKSGKVNLGYYKDEAFTSLKAYDITTSWKTEDAFVLTGIPAGAKLAFAYTPVNSAYTAGIDDITISVAPACAIPTELQASAIEATTATLSWTSEAENFKVQYTVNKENWGEEHAVNAKTFDLTELTPNTTYYARVKAVCGVSEESDYSSEIEFTTKCAVKTLPFAESFADGLPECWSAASQWAHYNYEPYAMRYTSSANGDLVLPEITLNDAAQLSFKHQSSYTSCSVILNDGENHDLGTFAKTGESYKTETIDLSDYTGKTVTITIRGNYYSGSRYLYIDDIAVSYKPVATPTNVVATQGNTTATITWDSEETGTWNLRYRVKDSGEDWAIVEGIEAKTYLLEGLTNGTSYEVQVQAVCSANRQSEWSALVYFTPEDCPSVTAVSFGIKTYQSVVVEWTTSGTTNCDVRYSTDNGENWTVAQENIEETSATLGGLSVGMVYTIAVKPSCGNDETWVAAAETFSPVYTAPEAAAASAISDNGATFTWSEVADAYSYEYAVTARKVAPTAWTEVAENTVSVNTLAAATEYDFFVRTTFADDGVSAYDSIGFATITVAPKNLTQVALSATSATYSWEKDGANTTFEYSLDGEAWTAVAEKQVVLNGLTGNTAYTLYVRSVYDGELRSANASVSFRTECEPVSVLPWNEGFEDYEVGSTTSAAPACWEFINVNNGSYPYAYVSTNSTYTKSGSKTLYIVASGSTDGYVILPEFSAALNTLQISFWHKEESATKSAILTLGYISDIEDAETFEAIKEFDRATSWQEEKEISLASVPANVRLAFKLGKATDNWYTGIDDIKLEVLPSCIKPILAEPVILPDGATLSWTAGNGETQFQYRVDEDEWTLLDENVFEVTLHGYAPSAAHTFYVRAYCGELDQSDAVSTSFTAVCPAPTAPEVSNIEQTTVTLSWTAAEGITKYQYKLNDEPWAVEKTVEGTSIDLTELTPGTSYTFYVRSYFSETSQSAETSVKFTTACAAIAALNEDFSDKATGALPACWDVEGATSGVTIASSGYSAFDGNGLYFTGNTDYVYVLLPEFSVALNTMQISFKHNIESTVSSGRVELGYYKEGAFTQIKSCEETAAKTWVNEGPIALTEVPDGARLAFAYKATTNTYTAVVDNIKVEVVPSCAVPTDLAVSEITDATATLTWTSEASAFKVQYTTDKDNWGEEHEAASASFDLTSLTPNTVYYARVKAVCGEENESEWSADIDFTTDCAAIDMLNENFADGVPACWKTSGTWSTDNWTYGSAAPSLKYNATAAGEITTVAVNVTKEEAVLQFNIQNVYNGSSYRAGRVIVKAAEVADFSTDFINSKDIATVQTIDLAAYYGKKITITFQVDALSSTKAVYIDDVKVIVKPCDTPKNLTAVASLDSVVLAWEQGGEETTYQYSVVKKGEAADWQDLEDGVRTVTVKGLMTDTLYTASVRSFCGEGREGETVLTADFTPKCPQPTDLAVTALSAHSATISWTAAEGIAKYQWSMVKDEWLDENIIEATGVALNGLSAAAEYTFYVRSFYSATSVSAAVSVSFTTECEAYTMAFAEDFDALTAGIPACWDNAEGTTTNASYRWNYYATGREGACVRFDSYYNSENNTNILKTPSIEIANTSKAPELSFNFKNPAGGAFAVLVYDVTADDTTALVLGELTDVAEWTQKTADLTDFKGHTVQVWFHATSNYANGDAYIYLDDVTVAEHKDIPSAISNTGADTKDQVIKIIENNVLYIIRDGIKYNAQGVRVNQ